MSQIELTLGDAPPEIAHEEETELLVQDASELVKEAENLSPEERKQVDDFAAQINLHDAGLISRYGEVAQQKSSGLAGSALKGVSGKDLGEIGNLLSQMVVEIKGLDPDHEKGGFSLFKNTKKKIETLRVKYDEVSHSLERISKELTGQRMVLLKDIELLDKLYDENLSYYKELTMYILAGKQKLSEVRNGELIELKNKAKDTGSQEDALAARDLSDLCDQFEKQLYDLELTRTICIQTAPQIRLVQVTDREMARKIQSSIVNTIPLWERRMELAIGMEHSKQAIQMQKAVTDITNQMLKDQSEALKINSIESAKESERGIVDMETLKKTNEDLIATIDEVMKIREDGRAKRQQAEDELREIEDQLKERLIGAGN